MPTRATDMLKVGALLAIAAGLGGCASAGSSSGGGDMMIEKAMDNAASPAPTGEVEDLAAEIERLSQSYREEFGVESGGKEQGAGGTAGEPACERVCEVAEAICSSSGRICAISGRFPQEGRFTERCGWAEGQCAESKNRCETCQP